MPLSFKDLRRFLEDNAPRPLAVSATAALAPLYDAAQTGEYRLAPIGALDMGQVRLALAMATGIPSRSTTVVTVAQLGPELATALDFARLAIAVRDRCTSRLRQTMDKGLQRAVDAHAQTLGMTLDMAVWDAVWDNADDALVPGPAGAVLDGIIEVCWSVMAAAILDDEETFRQMRPALRLVSMALPLGERVGEPGHWYLLASP